MVSEPNLFQMLANSRPATPAPIMASFLGMVSKFKAAIVSIIYLLSIGMHGKEIGMEPVAKMMCLASIIDFN